MAAAVYAGSFDPITNGHLAVIRAGLRLCGRLVIAVGIHGGKKPLFSFKTRKKLIEGALETLPDSDRGRTEVLSFDTLLIKKARELEARFLIRGLRSSADFDYEMQMAALNRALAPELQTVFLPAEDESRAISSSMVRQIAALGGDVSAFVPKNVALALAEKYAGS